MTARVCSLQAPSIRERPSGTGRNRLDRTGTELSAWTAAILISATAGKPTRIHGGKCVRGRLIRKEANPSSLVLLGLLVWKLMISKKGRSEQLLAQVAYSHK